MLGSHNPLHPEAAFIEKPFGKDSLLSTVRTVLDEQAVGRGQFQTRRMRITYIARREPTEAPFGWIPASYPFGATLSPTPPGCQEKKQNWLKLVAYPFELRP